MGIHHVNRRSGMVLLVVLGMLTFFSILAATYLVFSSQSRQSSFVIAARNTSAPDIRGLLDAALMTLIRGTDDPTAPFYGEDILSDYYGRSDSASLAVRPRTDLPSFTVFLGTGPNSTNIVRFPVILPATQPWNASSSSPWTVPAQWQIDDLFTGRIATFTEGPLALRSFNILRSRYTPQNGSEPGYHSIYVELPADFVSSGVISALNESQVTSLFYNSSGGNGYALHVNGSPRNSPGIGFDGNNLNLTLGDLATGTTLPPNGPAPVGFADLPVALQPNTVPTLGVVNKLQVLGEFNTGLDQWILNRGDFDESYDAADFANWFISYRDGDGKIIPSFHRPSVLNYILNEPELQSQFNDAQTRERLLSSLARATFRPLPFNTLNSQFTGSNANYGLRTPIVLQGSGAQFRLDQAAKALIGSPEDWNPWDVDNDDDGVPDSIWTDVGLPIVTSPEGKLLKPLVAPMIEDLSGRLNVNAHGNYEIPHDLVNGGVSSRALWASTRQTFNNTSSLEVFRGLGYGPAEVIIPPFGNKDPISNPPDSLILGDLSRLRIDRYQFGARADTTAPLPSPGVPGHDGLDILRNGWRPPLHGITVGYGYPVDAYGRAGIGLGRGGHLLMANSGLAAPTVGGDESQDDPYEFDPTGRLTGDRPFTLEELEAVLRSTAFDREFLPQRLFRHVQRLIAANPEFARALTTHGTSDDSPAVPSLDPLSLTPLQRLEAKQSFLKSVETLISGSPGTLSDAQIKELVAPELRLGRKIDVNRPFGNGIDDNGNEVVDEPSELIFENTNGSAFAVDPDSGATVPTGFANHSPDYGFGTGIDARQLLARHLYVLMMALTRDAEFPSFDPTVPLDATELPLYRARRIAQWAVNVVDYRDSDSIMTRFVFDANPFDGWTPPPDPAPEHYVVWGAEQPELLFSESLALHDVRVRDTDRDSSGRKKRDEDEVDPDETTDQVRIPQGSLFLELVNPRSPVEASGNDHRSKQAVPRELYRFDDESDQSDLSTLALDLSLSAPNGVPVWRLALSAPHPNPDSVEGEDSAFAPFDAEQQDPWELAKSRPNSASFEPTHPDELSNTTDPILLDRFVWFRSFQDIGEVQALTNLVPDMEANQVFFTPNSYATNQTLKVYPGQYLTIAPRQVTHLGSIAFDDGTGPSAPSNQRVEAVDGIGLVHYRAGATDTLNLTPHSTTDFAPAKSLIAGTFLPPGANWSSVFGADFVGLNVSEPLPLSGNYYPRPVGRYTSHPDNDEYPNEDAYLNYHDSGTSALDTPLDPGYERIPVSAANPEEPFLGTLPRYATAYLQRLANPLLPYHEVTNPYRTVDCLPIDLTVFSGEEREAPVTERIGDYARRSRQRTGQVDSVPRDALFSYSTNDEEISNLGIRVDENATAYFAFVEAPASADPLNPLDAHIYTSLGFLNTEYPLAAAGGVRVNPTSPTFRAYSPSIGMSGSLDPTGNVFERNFPQVPFAQHSWLNRPFASHLELMMVPASSQGRLFQEFSPLQFNTSNEEIAGYAEDAPDSTNLESVQRFQGPFRHLLNFFYGDVHSTHPMLKAEFGRLFDFVSTLPRYRGEIAVMPPSGLAGVSDDTSAGTPRSWLQQMYANPFNFRYANQRLGRINLNTLSEFPVWAGLMQGHMTPNEFQRIDSTSQLGFRQFLNDRRGFAPPGGTPVGIGGATPVNYDPTRFDPLLPTQFAGAYRRQLDAVYAPEVRSDVEALRRRGADASFLRRRNTLASPPPNDAMFVRDATQQPVPPVGIGGDHTLNRQRDAFIRYQTAMRMPNLTSDNSQTYLVWLTIGLFEVDATTQSLGREYNEDIGQNERYRAMFIIDRSRPVGFIPGQDLNARDVVIFEKYFQ